MKSIDNTLKTIITIITIIIICISIPGKCQDVPPPPPLNHNDSGDQGAGGGAPMGGGLGILMALAGTYGIKKTYLWLKTRRELEE